MGDPTVALGAEDVKRIVDYAKPWLRDTILELAPRRSSEIDAQLLERMVRVEEELKAQRELMAVRFEAADKRFEDLQANMDKRFEDLQANMDKRFESTQANMDKRFEDLHATMDKRFVSMQWTILVGLAVVTAVVTVFGLLA
ncbi:MAG: hypothetical protein ACOC1U_07485 [Spirochaetota bacterium]